MRGEAISGTGPGYAANQANQQCETRQAQCEQNKIATDVSVYRGRQHFETIHEMIGYHRMRVNQLEALARSLPLELPVGASEILAQLLRGA